MFRRRNSSRKPEINASPHQGVEEEIIVGEDTDSHEDYRFYLSSWLTHWHMPGAPGTGKTSLLEILLRFLISLDQGVTLIDPIGVLYDRVVNWLAHHPELAHNVIIISPGDTDPYWPGFNPFQKVPYIEDANTQSSLIADAICKVFGDDRETTVLLARKSEEAAEPLIQAGLTFLEMPLFYQLSKVDQRQKLAALSREDGIREEWRDFEALNRSQKRDELGSLRNRMPRFIRNRAVRLMLGRTRNVIDLADIVENARVVLVNLAPKRGILAPSHSYLLGCLLITFLTSYMRTRTEEQVEARKHYLVIDEFQNMLTPDIAGALDELRNFGLRMVMSHQRFGQLLREDRDLLDAVMIDAGIKAVFGRLSPEALELLEPLMYMGAYNLSAVKHQNFSGQEAVPVFYTLQELRYQKQVELYRQPRQHMTLKVLTEPSRRIKVANVTPYTRDPAKRQHLMETVVSNFPHYYMAEPDILAEIEARKAELEGSQEESLNFREPKRKRAK